MATIRHRLSRAANHFLRKTYGRYLPKDQRKRTSSALSLSPVSTSLLLGEIHHVAVRKADEVTVEPVWDSCVSADLTTLLHLGDRDAKDCDRRFGCNRFILGSDSVRKEAFRSFDRTLLPGTVRSFWGSGLMSVRVYSSNGSEPLYKTKTGYYDILEVASASTQAQIKTAYYKQSFIYHPDRNAGSDEATIRFSEISEAYTVLGNKALRRKYDRGLLTQSDLLSTSRPTGKESTGGGSGKQSQIRRSVMSAEGPGGGFNFDRFFKEHYQGQLQRDKEIRARKEEMLKRRSGKTEELKLGMMAEIGLGLLLMMTVTLIILLKPK